MASSSDDVFHPNQNFPPSVPYRLPEAPPPHIHPNYPYYLHIPMNREYLSQLQVSHTLPKPPSTSHNNPHFVIPPPRHVSPIGSPMPSLSRHHTTTQQNNHFLHSSMPPPSLIPLYHHLTGHPGAPPVQYIYDVPQDPPQAPPQAQPQPLHATVHSVTKALPSVSHLHVPTLTSKADFSAWDEGVTSSLQAHGLLGHILDPSLPPDLPGSHPVSYTNFACVFYGD